MYSIYSAVTVRLHFRLVFFISHLFLCIIQHTTQLESGRHAGCSSIFIASTASLWSFVQPECLTQKVWKKLKHTIFCRCVALWHLPPRRISPCVNVDRRCETHPERNRYITFILLLSKATYMLCTDIGSKLRFSVLLKGTHVDRQSSPPTLLSMADHIYHSDSCWLTFSKTCTTDVSDIWASLSIQLTAGLRKRLYYRAVALGEIFSSKIAACFSWGCLGKEQ